MPPQIKSYLDITIHNHYFSKLSIQFTTHHSLIYKAQHLGAVKTGVIKSSMRNYFENLKTYVFFTMVQYLQLHTVQF